VLKPIIDTLELCFDKLNEAKFNNELPQAVITIQAKGKRNAMGWCSINPIWHDTEKKDERREINICAEYANIKVLDIAEIMLHEMVHYYADLKGIKTTSRGGTFHNKKYKQYADQYGLEVEHDKKYGYAFTKLKKETAELVEKMNFSQDAFMLSRANDGGKLNKKKGSIKHTCPTCGNTARTTKDIPLICGDCKVEMLSDDGEDDESDEN
jgi:hypothetical protein